MSSTMIDGVEEASCVHFCMQTALEKDLQAKENQKQQGKGEGTASSSVAVQMFSYVK